MPMKKGTKALGVSPEAKLERAAIANRGTPASRAAAMKITAQEGTTNPSGGRPALKSQAAAKPTPKPTSRMPLVDKFVGTLKKESTPYTMGGSKK